MSDWPAGEDLHGRPIADGRIVGRPPCGVAETSRDLARELAPDGHERREIAELPDHPGGGKTVLGVGSELRVKRAVPPIIVNSIVFKCSSGLSRSRAGNRSDDEVRLPDRTALCRFRKRPVPPTFFSLMA